MDKDKDKVMKALECCADRTRYRCGECPLYSECEMTEMASYALNVIKSYERKNDKLQKMLKNARYVGAEKFVMKLFERLLPDKCDYISIRILIRKILDEMKATEK